VTTPIVFDVQGSDIRFGTAEDGTPYSVASDFAKSMGYLQASDATRLLEDDEKGQQIVLTPGGPQQMNVIYEDGMWELIFRSTLPGAKVIKKRVKAILKQIRETGRYEAEPESVAVFAIPTTFSGALELAARQARELEEVRAEITELAETNAKLSPRARIAEQYEANPGITPTVFHKMHFPEISERTFFEHLYRKDYLIDQRNTRWDARKQEWKDGPEHLHPTAKGKRYFYLAPKLDRNRVRRQQTLVIPGDAEHDLVAALERDGLPSRNRPALHDPQDTQFWGAA
jgi:prophage antirepressor-like protein